MSPALNLEAHAQDPYVFQRLCGRFPTIGAERVSQVLQECGGHAGQAAAALRDLTGDQVRPADPDDAEHVRTLLCSPMMFSHACKEQFRKFDANRDGYLQWAEILKLVASLYATFGLPPPPQGGVKAFFDASDANSDGILTEREFKHFFEGFLRYAFFDVKREKRHESPAPAAVEGVRVQQQTKTRQSCEREGRRNTKKIKEEWREVYQRLCERFPDFRPEIIAQALRQSNGHAGRAAISIRELVNGTMPAPVLDVEHPGASAPRTCKDERSLAAVSEKEQRISCHRLKAEPVPDTSGSQQVNQDVFDRLCARFPTVDRDRVWKALRNNQGHAGLAAATLRSAADFDDHSSVARCFSENGVQAGADVRAKLVSVS